MHCNQHVECFNFKPGGTHRNWQAFIRLKLIANIQKYIPSTCTTCFGKGCCNTYADLSVKN